MRFGGHSEDRGGFGKPGESREACARGHLGGGIRPEGRVQPQVTGCSALDIGSFLVVPTSLPLLGPRSRSLCQDPGAERGHQEPQPHPGWEKQSAGTPAVPWPPRPWRVRAQRSPPPSPGLACRFSGSRRQPPPQSRSNSREKSLIPGGGAAGGDPGARLHPPSQRSPPPSPLPWTEDPTPLKCKAPHLLWLLRIPQKVLCRQKLREPPTPPRVRGHGCFRSNRVTSEVTAGISISF